MAFKPGCILITGGGTGIGLGLAEALYKRGAKVIIAGRRKDVLEKVCAANAGMEYVILDVAAPESIMKARDELIARHPDLDAVMNNPAVPGLQSVTYCTLVVAVLVAQYSLKTKVSTHMGSTLPACCSTLTLIVSP